MFSCFILLERILGVCLRVYSIKALCERTSKPGFSSWQGVHRGGVPGDQPVCTGKMERRQHCPPSSCDSLPAWETGLGGEKHVALKRALCPQNSGVPLLIPISKSLETSAGHAEDVHGAGRPGRFRRSLSGMQMGPGRYHYSQCGARCLFWKQLHRKASSRTGSELG